MNLKFSSISLRCLVHYTTTKRKIHKCYIKLVTWREKYHERAAGSAAIVYHTLLPRVDALKHVQNEFLINDEIFAQISDARYRVLHDIIRCVCGSPDPSKMLRFRASTLHRAENATYRLRAGILFLPARHRRDTRVYLSRSSEIKNSILSAAR